MKTVILFFAIIFLQIHVSGQMIKPIVEFESGYYSYTSSFSTNLGSSISSSIDEYPIYTNITLGAKYKGFSFIQNVENFFGYKDGTSFNPYQIRYTTGLTYEVKRFKFAYEHMCFHPVIATYKDQFERFFFAGYDKFTVKIKIL